MDKIKSFNSNKIKSDKLSQGKKNKGIQIKIKTCWCWTPSLMEKENKLLPGSNKDIDNFEKKWLCLVAQSWSRIHVDYKTLEPSDSVLF